jgi:cellulose synthase/poly-beta-1,6-N-acetylglucosamine synthase-like glycosyltransferase
MLLLLQVISSELIRNLCLTMAAVVSVTLILISDLVTVFWVFTCIAFTLIDLLGLMYYWGLTVEISSSIIVIQATGLAIDYSAHIGHTFTTIRGSKSSTKSAFFFVPCFIRIFQPKSPSVAALLWFLTLVLVLDSRRFSYSLDSSPPTNVERILSVYGIIIRTETKKEKNKFLPCVCVCVFRANRKILIIIYKKKNKKRKTFV